MDYVLQNKTIEQLTKQQEQYFIGIDQYDANTFVYCLAKRVNDTYEILLAKRMTDEKEFNEEVQNIAKYFNADYIV